MNLRDAFSPALIAELEALVDERVRAALAERENGAAPEWFTLDEASAFLRVSPRTLERAIAAGRLRSTTLGRRRLLRRSDLDAFAQNGDGGGQTPSPPDPAASS